MSLFEKQIEKRCARYGDDARQKFLQKQLILRAGSIHTKSHLLMWKIGEAKGGGYTSDTKSYHPSFWECQVKKESEFDERPRESKYFQLWNYHKRPKLREVREESFGFKKTFFAFFGVAWGKGVRSFFCEGEENLLK